MRYKKVTPKLNRCLEEVLLHNQKELQFYFYFLNYVDFYVTDELPTMAVTVVDMRMALLYNEEFVEELSDIEVVTILLHECDHLLHNHLERGKYYDRQMANIAMDMIINHLIMTYHKTLSFPKITEEWIQKQIEKGSSQGHTINEDNLAKARKAIGETYCVTLDENYKGELVFEPLYRWLKEEKEKDDKGEKSELTQRTKDLLERCGEGQSLDTHLPNDEMMQEIKEQLAKEGIEKVKVRLRGYGSNSTEEKMKMLLKAPKKNNLRTLKRVISAFKGRIKEKTYTRLSRKLPGLIKGNKKVSQSLVAGLDVSGSMYRRFELVLSELFRDGYEIDLVQVDTQIQKIDKVKKKNDLKSMMIKGLGGTELQPFVNYVLDPKNKMRNKPVVILTDGYCDHLDFKGTYQQFLIISCGEPVKFSNGGNVKQVVIQD